MQHASPGSGPLRPSESRIQKRELLRRFRPFKGEAPAHDHLGNILVVLAPGQFPRCCVAWTTAVTGLPDAVVAIDGKTARRSCRKQAGAATGHVVPAFAARQRMRLGQVKVSEMSNGIIAIPERLEMPAIAWGDRRP